LVASPEFGSPKLQHAPARPKAPLPGPSLRWHQKLLTSAPGQLSLRNGLIVANAVTPPASARGMLAALDRRPTAALQAEAPPLPS